MLKKIKNFIAKETVLCVAAACALLTMFLVPPDKEYLHYMLLLTFVCFFTVSENLGRVDAICVFLQRLLGASTLLTAVGTSQIISNVPAAVVLSGFTNQWQDMLSGVNIGGLSTPIASLASLITIKFYMRWPNTKILPFLGFFTAFNIVFLAILLLFVWMI